MRYSALILLAFLLLSLEGISQIKPFRFGVRVAPNIAWVSPDTDGYESEGAQPGFSWGFIADITLTQNYFIKTGFSMDYLNVKLSNPTEQVIDPVTEILVPGKLTRDINLRYLDVPLTLKMRTNRFGNSAFFGEIGFGAGFNIKATSSDEFVADDGSYSATEDHNISDDITLVKGSLIVGGGYAYFIDRSTSLIASLTFNNGLSNILTGQGVENSTEKPRAKIHYFQLNLGIMF